jgi:hypothetical protein
MNKQSTSDGLHPTMKQANVRTFAKTFKGKMKTQASNPKGTAAVKR